MTKGRNLHCHVPADQVRTLVVPQPAPVRPRAALIALCLAVGSGVAISDGPDAAMVVAIDAWPVPLDSIPHDSAVAPDGSIWYTGQQVNAPGRLGPDTSSMTEVASPTPNLAIGVRRMVRRQALVVQLFAAAGQGQGAAEFRGRLSTVPIDLAMQSTVAGRGTATATLTGRKLVVTGAFEGLKSPATVAHIHLAPKGLRGPAVLDLTVSAATGGTLDGSFELTAQQVNDLNAERLYIQIHSEKAPDGNLWGWLLPREARK